MESGPQNRAVTDYGGIYDGDKHWIDFPMQGKTQTLVKRYIKFTHVIQFNLDLTGQISIQFDKYILISYWFLLKQEKHINSCYAKSKTT